MNKLMIFLESVQNESPDTILVIMFIVMLFLLIYIPVGYMKLMKEIEKEEKCIKRTESLIESLKEQCEFEVSK